MSVMAEGGRACVSSEDSDVIHSDAIHQSLAKSRDGHDLPARSTVSHSQNPEDQAFVYQELANQLKRIIGVMRHPPNLDPVCNSILRDMKGKMLNYVTTPVSPKTKIEASPSKDLRPGRQGSDSSSSGLSNSSEVAAGRRLLKKKRLGITKERSVSGYACK